MMPGARHGAKSGTGSIIANRVDWIGVALRHIGTKSGTKSGTRQKRLRRRRSGRLMLAVCSDPCKHARDRHIPESSAIGERA